MVQKVNVSAQRFFFSLLPTHSKSVYFFKIFFCYKLLFDLFLTFFLQKYKFKLLKFYVGFSKNFFFLNLYIFKNYILKKQKKGIILIKNRKIKNSKFFKNFFFKKLIKSFFFFLSFNNVCLSVFINFKIFLSRRNLFFKKEISNFFFRKKKFFLKLKVPIVCSKSKKAFSSSFRKNNFFRNFVLIKKDKRKIVKKFVFKKGFSAYKNSKSFNNFFLVILAFFLKHKRSFNSFIFCLKELKFFFSNVFFFKVFFNAFFLNKFFFWLSKCFFYVKRTCFFFKDINFSFKKNLGFLVNNNFYIIKNLIIKKKLIFFFLKLSLQTFLQKQVKLCVYDSFSLLNKFSKFEFFLNAVLVKKNYFKVLNFYKLQRNSRFIFILNFIQILFLSLRLKSFGFFLKLLCKEIGSFKKQWLSIKKVKKLINEASLKTINFFGFHVLISGTIQGRLRTTRFHIFKNLKPSVSNLNFETYFLYEQSFSIYGVLGIKFWVYY